MHRWYKYVFCVALVMWGMVGAGATVPDSLSWARKGWFRYIPYGHSLYADVHPNMVRIDITCSSNHPAYDWTATQESGGTSAQRFKPYTFGVFGFQLPVWRGEYGGGKYGVSLVLPLSANLWLDIFEPQTAPVVNTDYRIGMPTITFIHRLPHPIVHNYSVSWSPFKHESTHIGDELQIEHVEAGYPLKRVNVSNNYTEWTVTMNEPEDRYAECHTLRAGFILLWKPSAGWYTVMPSDGDITRTSPRLSPWEAYLQYQYQTPSSRLGFQGVLSAEIRNRVLYGYTSTGKELQPEKRVFTYNVFLGARYNTPGYDGYFSRVALGVRAYYGNCPYGQFRNINNYSQIGVCLVFE